MPGPAGRGAYRREIPLPIAVRATRRAWATQARVLRVDAFWFTQSGEEFDMRDDVARYCNVRVADHGVSCMRQQPPYLFLLLYHTFYDRDGLTRYEETAP